MNGLVTFGETMLRLSPPGDRRVESADTFEVHAGGAESNVAIAAQRLGVDAAWLSKLPASPPGRRVAAAIRSHGVDPLVTWSDDGRQGTYYLERGDEPRGTEVTYDRENTPIRSAAPDELPVDRIRDAAAFLTTGITPALSETLAATTAELLETARDAGTRTVLDVNYRSKLWSPGEAARTLSELLPLVDTLVVARRDAATVFGRDDAAATVARGLADEYGPETVILTRGDAGALAVREGGVYEQPAFQAGSAHTIGTGDAFVGGFLARRLAGEDVSTALEYGAATAALKRTVPGDAAVVTPAEVERVVKGGVDGISR
jgi:2-dehydro-3-deoxygluconokinase